MKPTKHLFLAACLGLSVASLAACQKEKAHAQPAEAISLAAPKTQDDAAWKAYLSDVVSRNLGATASNPILYYLPGDTDADFQGKYDRLAEQVEGTALRGVVTGGMVAFGSPVSTKMADLVVVAFAKAAPGSFKGARVLFVGSVADSDRVKAVIEPTGATYVFIDAR